MLPNWTENDFEVNGTRIHYYRSPGTGAPAKPPLVLVHGFSDNGLCWTPTAKELQDRYDILMPEARGHGKSARVQRGDQFDMVADLAALLKSLGWGPAVVAGHSMGAGIASQLGARYPELVRALVLEDPPWFQPRPEAEAPGPRGIVEDSPMGQWVKRLQPQTLEEVIAECRAEHPTWPDQYVLPWCQGKKQLDPNFLAAHNGAIGSWKEVVEAIRCPVLLVTAEPSQGGIVTPELAEQIVAQKPNFQVKHFSGIGHHIRFAVHEPYMQAFEAFLAELP